MPEPTFVYHASTPPGQEQTRFQVYNETTPNIEDAFLARPG
ncbi:hypothetical protein ACIQPR_48630 [Streptomyces sp. NPDC091280]